MKRKKKVEVKVRKILTYSRLVLSVFSFYWFKKKIDYFSNYVMQIFSRSSENEKEW
jgi:hypothetical protein